MKIALTFVKYDNLIIFPLSLIEAICNLFYSLCQLPHYFFLSYLQKYTLQLLLMKVSITFQKNVSQNRKREWITEIKSTVEKLNSKQTLTPQSSASSFHPLINQLSDSGKENISEKKLKACQKKLANLLRNESDNFLVSEKEEGQLEQKQRSRKEDRSFGINNFEREERKLSRGNKKLHVQTVPEQRQKQLIRNQSSESEFKWVGTLIKEMQHMQSSISQKFNTILTEVNKVNTKISRLESRVLHIENGQRENQEELMEIKAKEKRNEEENSIFWGRFEKIESRYKSIGNGCSRVNNVGRNRVSDRVKCEQISGDENLLDSLRWQDGTQLKDNTLDTYFTK